MPPNAAIEISWQDDAPPPDLDEARLREALQAFLAGLGLAGAGLSLLVADDAALAALNRTYRDRPGATDVLSWSYLSPDTRAPPDAAPPALAGEIALSLPRARVQAAEHGWDLATEVLRLLAHGCAHIAGYDHPTPEADRTMKRVETRLLAAVGLVGLYPDDDDEPHHP